MGGSGNDGIAGGRLTYASAGVDIEAAEESTRLMKRAVAATHNARVMTGLSNFGCMFAGGGFRDPVLVSSTDGVGTKLMIAAAMDKHDTVGQDLVAMCVDDVICQGAPPMFFLDYIAVGKLYPEKVAAIVGGIARGCELAGCALIGGETAELPGMYGPDDYDLAGFAVGMVERERLIDGTGVQAGDVLLGLASSGLHTNGVSLARKALLDVAGLALDKHIGEFGRTLGEELLEPTRIYSQSLAAAFEQAPMPHAVAHITGGGLWRNINRILPDGLGAEIDTASFPCPPVFKLINEVVDAAEMLRTFNMGVGMALSVAPGDMQAVAGVLAQRGETVYEIGRVSQGDGVVFI
jgi:phosphoribosylformylglycinamidine cyclo-ligase